MLVYFGLEICVSGGAGCGVGCSMTGAVLGVGGAVGSIFSLMICGN